MADYMERQHQHADKEDSSQSSKTSGSKTGSSSNSQTSNQTTNNSQNMTGSKSGTHSDTSSGTDSRQGSQKGTTNNSGADVVTTVKEQSGQDARTSKSNTKATMQRDSDEMSLTGSTPDSSMYPGSGAPAALNWQFTSGQAEKIGKQTGSDISDGSSEDSGTSQSQGKDVSTTQHGAAVTQNGSSTDSGQHSEQSSGRTGEDSTQDIKGNSYSQGTITNAGRQDEATQGEQTGNASKSASGESRERYSGRHESPQELLDKAWTYIMRANAFKWLCQQLETCFLAELDYEEDDCYYGPCFYL